MAKNIAGTSTGITSTMQEYVLQMNQTNSEALANVRLVPGLRVAVNGNTLWVRGIAWPDGLDKTIWQLPAANVYQLDETGLLFTRNSRVPVAKLPDLKWTALQQYVPVEPPVSAIKGETHEKIDLKLLPAVKQQTGIALLTTLQHWKAYAEMAPQARLKRLKFAVSGSGDVLITGTPLPAIPGKEYWLNHGMLLPCGYDFEYSVLAALLPQQLNLTNGDTVIFDTNGNRQKIEAGNFVSATRSAVRLTSLNQPLPHG